MSYDQRTINRALFLAQQPISTTMPEPKADVRAQISALENPRSRKRAVFLARGTQVPRHLPRGIQAASREEGTLLSRDTRLLDAFYAAPRLTEPLMAKLLDYPQSKDQIPLGQHRVVRASDGRGVGYETAVSPENVHEAVAIARQHVPRGHVSVTSPLEALRDRLHRTAHASGGAVGGAQPHPSTNIRHRRDVLAPGALREHLVRHGYAAGGAPAQTLSVDDFMNAGAAGPAPSTASAAPQPTAATTVPVSAFFNAGPGAPAASQSQGGGTIPVSAFFGAPGGAPPPPQKQSPGLLKSAAAGAMSGVQDVADAAKWMWDNASAPGEAELSAADDPGLKASDLMPKKSAPAQIPGVTKFVQSNQPQTLGEKMAYGAGAMVPFAAAQLVPGGGEAADVGALSKLGTAVKGAGTMLASGAASGAGQSVGQTVGQDIGGNTGGEVGGTIGALVGGLLPSATGYALSKAAEGLGDVAPVTQGLKNQQAARVLTDTAGDTLPAVRNTIASRLTPGATAQAGDRSVPLGPNGEILPGSAPTVAQLSGSGPLARLEEGLKATPSGDALQAADASQGAARAAAIRDVAPDEGDPASLGEFVRRAQADQDAQAQKDIADQSNARDTALAAQPGASGEISPYQAGQQFQGALGDADAARKQAVDNLFNSLRQRNPVLDVSPLRQTTNTIQGSILASKAGDVSDTERQLYARAADLGASPETTWSQVQQLRSEVGNAITDSAGKYGAASPATQRLVVLKQGIDDATASAVDRLPQQDPEWVAIQQQFLGTQPSQASVDQARMALERMAATGRAGEGASTTTGTNGPSSPVGGEGGPQQANYRPAGNRAAGSGAGGYGGSQPGAPDAQGTLAPRWDASDASTYTEGLASHAARKGLYANPQIGPLLAKAPGGNLALAPEEVVKQAVPTGPRGALMARSVAATAADDPNIMSYYESIVGLDLRNAVVRDGQVSRPLLVKWARDHQALLSEMPQVAQRLTSIDAAQEMVDQAAKNATMANDIFRTRALSSIIGGDDPSVAMQTLLSGSPQDARKFMAFVRRSPAAEAGAQKAMADYLAQSLLVAKGGAETGDEAVRIAGLRAMVKNPSKMVIIRDILGPQAPAALRRIVDDFDLYNTAALSRLGAAGSRTTPLAEAVRRISEPRTVLGRMFQQLSHPAADAVVAGMANPVAAIPTYLATSAAKAALSRSQQGVARVVAEALADPRLFMKLTTPIPKGATAEARFMRQLRGVLANAALHLESSQGANSPPSN